MTATDYAAMVDAPASVIADPDANIVDELPALPDAAYPDGTHVVLRGDNHVYRAAGEEWTRLVEGLAGEGVSGHWQRGGYNGDFALPPPDPDSPIDNDTNPLRGWTLDTTGDAGTAMWVVDTDSGSGGSVLLSLAAGAAGDSISFSQFCKITSTRTRNRVYQSVGSFVTEGDTNDIEFFVSAQYYQSDKTTPIGVASLLPNTLGALDSESPFDSFTSQGHAPSNAGYILLSFGLRRGSALDADTGSASVSEVAIIEGGPQVYVADVSDPTYAPGQFMQENGIAHLIGGASLTDGGASIRLSGPGDDITLSPAGEGNVGGTVTVNGTLGLQASGAALLLPRATSPAQTADGSVVWDSDDDVLTIGTGAGRKTMLDTAGAASTYAPIGADYLVGTASGALTGEIAVGTTPGGELGGTWASPTVDATHSGSSHAGVISTHEAAGDPHTGYRLESAKIALADMDDLAQDQFIGRTTASTGVPQTATITSAARTVLDDTTVGAMVNTLGGASATGTGGLMREGSPTTTGTFTAAAVTMSGLLTLSNGQIAFPATQNASADANTLDDYEEGTWTPALAWATVGSSSVSHSVQVGHYTKIGRQVTVTFSVTATVTRGTGSGTFQMSGLPFTPQNVTSSNARFACSFGGYSKANYTWAVFNAVPNSTTGNFIASGSGQAVALLSGADIQDGTVTVAGSGPFFV